jgi:hypothetical protein
MGAHVRPQGCSGSQPQDKACALLCRCLETYTMWIQSREPHEQNARRAAYRAALEDLYVFLYPDLQNLVIRWLLGRVGSDITDDQSQLLVMHEVVDAYVMNVFAAITPILPNIVVEEHTDVHAELLTLAEQSLYNQL